MPAFGANPSWLMPSDSRPLRSAMPIRFWMGIRFKEISTDYVSQVKSLYSAEELQRNCVLRGPKI